MPVRTIDIRPAGSFRVLIVDDDRDTALETERALRRSVSDRGLHCHRAGLFQDAMQCIRESGFDLILIDTNLPDLPSPVAIKALRDAFAYAPIIALSKHPDDVSALEWVRSGADDCLYTGVLNERILARVVRYAIERANTYHALHKRSQNRHIINAMLRLSLEDLPLEELLRRSLDIVLAAPFASIQHKGGIFLTDATGRSLRLTAQRNLSEAVRERCRSVPLGYCLCGRAAQSRELLHADHGGEGHGIRVDSDRPHGHYCVPIIFRDVVLGVLVLYLDAGHTANRDELEFLDSVAGTLAGVIERVRAQENLVRIHEQNSRLLAAITSILVGVDAGDRVSHWNRAAERCFGLGAEQVLGKPIVHSGIDWDWAHVSLNVLACLSSQGPTPRFEVRYRPRGGHNGLLSVTVTPFTESDSTPGGYLLIAEDVTEQKSLESRLQQARKLQSIGQLAAGIAHEINTPIQYVGDNLRFLQDTFKGLLGMVEQGVAIAGQAKGGRPDPERIAHLERQAEAADLEFLLEETPEAIGQSLEGVERVADIVRAMKDFSHPGSTEKSAMDINRAIESTITVSRNVWKYVAEMETDLDPRLPTVPCLAGPFNEVILNLLVNAAHAVAAHLDESADTKGLIRVATRRDGRWAEIRISDTGTGIPEEIRPYIFDPFFTTKEVGQGTGQGLAMCHDIVVEKHRGEIGFETETGKGTTFIVRLPLEASD